MGCRVLVVEDDDATRELLVELFTEHGHEVVSATNGLDALNAALKMVQAAAPPSLIVLDLAMPVMDGPSFRKQQRRIAELAQIPVVVLSGSPDFVDTAVEMEAAAYLPKPFDDWGLLHVVNQLGES